MESNLRIADTVARLKNMFLEHPGTRISPMDVARLSGVDTLTCDLILQTLEKAGFLRRRADGRFTRSSD
jgi:DNA-binding IclR family transcriptional regulator